VTDRLNEVWFERLRRNADEVLRMRRHARIVLDQRPADRYDGLGHLLGKVLPPEPESVDRLAEALGVGPALLAQLRASELDPVHVPHAVLAVLGQILGLSEDSFLELVWRDHERFALLESGATVRGPAVGVEHADIERQLRDAWVRAAMDDPARA
jgi:hypothetical protein